MYMASIHKYRHACTSHSDTSYIIIFTFKNVLHVLIVLFHMTMKHTWVEAYMYMPRISCYEHKNDVNFRTLYTRQASADSYLIRCSLRNLSRVTEWYTLLNIVEVKRSTSPLIWLFNSSSILWYRTNWPIISII